MDIGDTVWSVSGRWARVHHDTDEYETTIDRLTVIGVGSNGKVAVTGRRASRGGAYIEVYDANELFTTERSAQIYADDLKREQYGR